MDLLVAAALALLVLGVAGSVLPLLPSGALSFVGLLVYWWQTGQPGPLLLAALVGVSVLAVAVDWLAGFVGARASGVDTRTSILAGLVGFVLLFPGGPLGLLLGVAGTVFAVEFRANRDAEASARRAAYATVGVVASAGMQVVLTAVVLGAVLWVQFL
ncbi:DUF456 domain-containing protein [Halobacterium jilantaiense]|uniref:DUF456 domain-containing protein n=1 Tax=Halobacterium jilantaiense TaxID=355548 RepID=A0A1I0QTI9_9EURY|nr:DUF456 domain-containing protein [Halobacterium jilantaiense]SEW30954.1 hypothetical protein SAMN04487945_2977 [Halobacterium jilantaiense]